MPVLTVRAARPLSSVMASKEPRTFPEQKRTVLISRAMINTSKTAELGLALLGHWNRLPQMAIRR